MPCWAGQIPTSAFESEVFPDALAPSKANPMPALSEKETFETIGFSPPGAATLRACTESSRQGRGSATGGAGGFAVTLQMSRRRARPRRPGSTPCW